VSKLKKHYVSLTNKQVNNTPSQRVNSFFWFRRDLRIDDNAGLFKALSRDRGVQCVFIFDVNILGKLSDPKDARVTFIFQRLEYLQQELRSAGSDLWVFYGDPLSLWSDLLEKHKPKSVFLNRDYEPYGLGRDEQVYQMAKSHKVEVIGTKDHVILEKNEVLKGDGSPYTVFSPYAKKWRATLTEEDISSRPSEDLLEHTMPQTQKMEMPSLSSMGFESFPATDIHPRLNTDIVKTYESTRNFPGNDQGTTRMGVHLRFGSISTREVLRKGRVLSSTFENELIWRDFYQMILFHFPHSVDKAIRPAYDRIDWVINNDHFTAWCQGKTGYPLVDAGMRELNQTGYMHNRVRMVVASFLTKHLLLDWRLGERYFAEKLIDFELASNIGGWQWASGSGCDAAPYFRVFNPALQLDKFDKDLTYVKKWVTEYGTPAYPQPIVDHKWARERALSTYKLGLAK